MRNRKHFYTLVGNKLRDKRKWAMLETTEISDVFGISTEQYVKYELGYPIPLQVLTKISYFYNCELKELLPTLAECNVLWCLSNGEMMDSNGNRFIRTPNGVVMEPALFLRQKL